LRAPHKYSYLSFHNHWEMKKSIVLFWAVVLSVNSIFACFNETRVTMDGNFIVSDIESPVPYGRNYAYEKKDLERRLKKLDSTWKADGILDDYSDYGVTLAYLSRYQEALKVFQEIEAKDPGRYATAANMGTTYELLGNNELAYQWIKKAVEIDPSSHDSSEWLHVKILEVKIKGDKYLNTQYLLGTDFGTDVLPQSSRSKSELWSLRNAIFYQLNERVSFIKPKDKIVALLLYELGNICTITDEATSAYRVYQKAKEYGYDSPLFQRRFEYVRELQSKIDSKPDVKKFTRQYLTPRNVLTGGFVIFASLMGIFIYRARRKSRS
jgi:tetratricopeptide (TPR) repeat protein